MEDAGIDHQINHVSFSTPGPYVGGPHLGDPDLGRLLIIGLSRS
jgi:hypothetical protein